MPIYYPQLETSSATRDFQEQFLGYNHNLRIADGEFYDMQNMTGDYYPVLSPRKKRGLMKQMTLPQGMLFKDALCYIDNGHLYVNGNEIESFYGTTTSNTRYQKKLISMGAYLLVFNLTDKGMQDGWYVNTENSSEHGFIDQVNELNCSEKIPLIFTMCSADGDEYQFENPKEDNYVLVSDSVPSTENIKNGFKWLDTSGDVHYIKVWSETNSMWSSISTTYIKINMPGIGEGLSEGDAVKIMGCSIADCGDMVESQINDINNTMIIKNIEKVEGDSLPSWIVVTGILDQVCKQTEGTVTVARQAPYMDFICECNNRLWGCRYGINREGETVNEVYACKQGDFKNWFCYAGISTDSYAASVGSDGVWTGCVHYGSYVMFFKENCIHKLYGNMPSDYQLIEQKVRGLQRGSEKSICTVNETLFYKSASDICYYDGSLPVAISYPLGEDTFTEAVAGNIGSKYYICMTDSSGKRCMYVYDASKQMWHKEDEINISEFCRVDTDLFFIDADTNKLMNISGGTTVEDDFKWYAETGNIGYSYSDNKYVGRMLLRLYKPIQSETRLYIQYDDTGEWESIASLNGGGTRSFSIPVTPRRCDHFRVRIEGCGECKIYSISKVLEIGSDA